MVSNNTDSSIDRKPRAPSFARLLSLLLPEERLRGNRFNAFHLEQLQYWRVKDSWAQ